MFKIFRRYYFYINAIHYTLCKQYECNNNFLLRIIDKIIMFFYLRNILILYQSVENIMNAKKKVNWTFSLLKHLYFIL